MSARWLRLAAAVALLSGGCTAGRSRARRDTLPPPARQARAGAPAKSAGPGPGPATRAEPATSPAVARALETASSLVGRRTVVVDGVDYGPGCAALVRAAFARAGRELPPAAADAGALQELARREGALVASRRPAAGDLVFLADAPGGAAHHVGLVARIDADGTALVLHRVARGVLRLRMNLARPELGKDPASGRWLNDSLVVGARTLPAGSLVVGVSDLLRRG